MEQIDREFIIKNSPHMTIQKMYTYLNGKYSKTQIKNFCTNNGIEYQLLSSKDRGEIVSFNNKNRATYNRTPVNKSYFKHWSKNMAYVFGLWCADGYISQNNGGYYFSIKLKKSDKYLLELILRDMSSKHKTYERSDNSCEICFSCKEIYNDIVLLGGRERKSLTMQFPEVPPQYVGHFIRGYFDGDGSVNDRNTGYLIGTHEFCNRLNEVLLEQNIYISSIKQKHPESGLDNNCYCLNLFKKKEFEKFERFIYSGVNEDVLFLKRKDRRQFYNIV